MNWNGLSFLDACLSALSKLDYPAYNILLVDNNSTDDSVDFVRRRFPHIAILQNERNLGYAGGNNRALVDLSADYAILVNPDIIVTPDWLTHLIAPMHTSSSIGIAGCKLLYPGGQIIQHAGGAISHPQAMPVQQGMYETDAGQFDALRDVDYVTGAAIAISRSALQKIGPLDEGYFMYFEEADWCTRARAAGYRVVFVPQSVAIHDESAIAVRGSYSYLRRFHTGRWRYLLKHFEPAEILTTTVAAEELWLAERQISERYALKQAYRTTHIALNEILTARAASGGAAFDAGEKIRLEEGLIRLRLAAAEHSIDQEQLDRLAQKAQIRETDLHSPTPIAGPIFAKIRSLWARVAIKEQAASFVTQQTKINRMLANELRELENNLRSVESNLLLHDQKQIEIKRQQEEVKADLKHAYQLLDSIRTRLERRY